MNSDSSNLLNNDPNYSSAQSSCEVIVVNHEISQFYINKSFFVLIKDIFYHNKHHIVLFELPMIHEILRPHISVEKWDGDHVRMPFSKESKFVDIYDGNKKNMRLRWELIIKSLKTEYTTSHDLENAIISYNTRYEKIWNFKALHILFNRITNGYSIQEQILKNNTSKNRRFSIKNARLD